MEMTKDEKKGADDALKFARKNKKKIAKRLTDPHKHPPNKYPVSVFMAGSPGAGKTEASIELLSRFSADPVIRIDPDELRNEFPAYTGSNAWLFQGAVSILVDCILDRIYEQKQNFLLDGTLSRYDVACKNVERAINKNRTVQILYVYQKPTLAWEFVQAREAAEGRCIRKEDFIEQYFSARKVVTQLKREFGKAIKVDLLMKNNDNTSKWYKAGVDQIDNHIDERYTPAELEKLLPGD